MADAFRKEDAAIFANEIPHAAALEPAFFGSEGCTVCGGFELEDQILLCDGPGCKRETHMFCLRPILTTVPEGDWYCDLCDPLGSTAHLERYLQLVSDHRGYSNPRTELEYQAYIEALYLPFEEWTPLSAYQLQNELAGCGPEYVGKKMLLFCTIDQRYHIGRIVSARKLSILGVWEYLVAFKSGLDGRNRACCAWIDPNEHDCLISSTLGWLRSSESPWWPAQRFLRSPKRIAQERHFLLHASQACLPCSSYSSSRKSPRSSFPSRPLTSHSSGGHSHYLLYTGTEHPFSPDLAPLFYFFQKDSFFLGDASKQVEMVPIHERLVEDSLSEERLCAALLADVEEAEEQAVLSSYSTVGEDELRAWTLSVDSQACPLDLVDMPPTHGLALTESETAPLFSRHSFLPVLYQQWQRHHLPRAVSSHLSTQTNGDEDRPRLVLALPSTPHRTVLVSSWEPLRPPSSSMSVPSLQSREAGVHWAVRRVWQRVRERLWRRRRKKRPRRPGVSSRGSQVCMRGVQAVRWWWWQPVHRGWMGVRHRLVALRHPRAPQGGK